LDPLSEAKDKHGHQGGQRSATMHGEKVRRDRIYTQRKCRTNGGKEFQAGGRFRHRMAVDC
jgi:hypothetical protein